MYYASLVGLIPSNVTVIWANSIDYLKKSKVRPDIIYLDPMFKDTKSAKSKKNMQLIQNLVDRDVFDDKLLFVLSMNIALDKVIVKRDNKQKTIHELYNVSYQKYGKTVRYDIYQTRGRLYDN